MSSDKNSLELIYVYIKKFKLFKEQGFCLCPEYNISCKNNSDDACLLLKIRKKKNIVDLFKDKNVNLSVVCGKNGCGKTTLLEAIQQNSNEVVCVFRNDKEEFFATEKLLIDFDGRLRPVESKELQKGRFANSINSDDFSLRNIVNFYVENPKLFDGILHKSDKLFSNYRVKLWNVEECISNLRTDGDSDDLLSGLLQKLQSSEGDFEENLFLLYALSNDKDFLVKYKAKKMNEADKPFVELFEESYRKTFGEVFALQKLIFKNERNIFDYEETKESIKRLEECYKYLLKKAFGYNEFSIPLDSFVFYDGFAKIGNSERHVNDLSFGKVQEIKYRHQLFNVLKNQNTFVCCIDEPEAHLHPEWCRRFLYDFLKSFQDVKEILKADASFTDRKITFVISTHSPFILSDVTKDNVIYLERQDDGFVMQVNNDKNIFAGNIGELFTENFFMEETIGEFASEKIRDIIKIIKSEKEVNVDKVAECERLIELVGDELLRKLLWDMWKRRHEENQAER